MTFIKFTKLRFRGEKIITLKKFGLCFPRSIKPIRNKCDIYTDKDEIKIVFTDNGMFVLSKANVICTSFLKNEVPIGRYELTSENKNEMIFKLIKK
jgi:hypothetical protein